MTHKLVVGARCTLVTITLLLASCGGGARGTDDELVSRGTPPLSPPTGATTSSDARAEDFTETEAAAQTTTPALTGDAHPPRSALASAIQPLDSATYDPSEHQVPLAPTAIRIDDVEVLAPVVPVGVEADGALEIPPAAEVGWYAPGVVPGAAEGSAVLAGHIAFDGENGAFVRLDEVELGSRVEVFFADGSERAFEVVAVQEYLKEDLPVDALFSRTSVPLLALITCGGAFNPDLRSYESNVVAFAVPL